MQLEDYFDFQAPDVIRLKGHRIGLEHVIERYHEGYSAEQIALDFPGVELEQIYGTFAYYLHNRVEADAYLERINAEVQRRMREYDAQPPSPLVQRLRAMQRRQEQSAA